MSHPARGSARSVGIDGQANAAGRPTGRIAHGAFGAEAACVTAGGREAESDR